MGSLRVKLAGRCERCLEPMTARVTSFFTDEVICMECVREESVLIGRLKMAGEDPGAYADSGSLPTATSMAHKG